MCSSDGQRMFEAAAVGSLLAGGPLVAVLGVAYNLYILGPTSLLGSAVFILFYPFMVSTWLTFLVAVLKQNLHQVVFSSDVQLQADGVLQEEGGGHHWQARAENERDPQLHQVHQDVRLGQSLLTGCPPYVFTWRLFKKEAFAVLMMIGMLFTLRYSRGGTSDPRAHRLLSEHHGGRGSNRCCHRQRGDILHPHVAGIWPNCCSGNTPVCYLLWVF